MARMRAGVFVLRAAAANQAPEPGVWGRWLRPPLRIPRDQKSSSQYILLLLASYV